MSATPSPLPDESKLRLKLFVAGQTPRSYKTITALRQICAEYIHEDYQLEIIDIYQQPALAREAQIIAIPTLVKYTPTPKKVCIGDLSRTERVLNCLGLAA